MRYSTEYYIRLCKEQIEKRYFLVEENALVQRNLELLSQKIEEKTGVSISLSTLKRIWKDDFKQRPQTATLNALAAILDYKDWQEFVERNQDRAKRGPVRKILVLFSVFVAACILLWAMIFLLSGTKEQNELLVTGDINFSAKNTELLGVPSTVIFNYDVSNVAADSFYFQQSWNDKLRKLIDPDGQAISSIYYESGFHRAKLIANRTKIAELPVHILSDGWEPHVYYSSHDVTPLYFKDEDIINNGTLHIPARLLQEKNIDFSEYFYTRTVNSRKFNVSSDNFTFVSRMKLDSLQYSECPWMSLIVVTDVHIFQVRLQNKGCEHHAYYKLGEVQRGGANNDLSALGCNIYQWQELVIRVRNKHATISINEIDCIEEEFKEDFGDIVALIFVFERTGSIDYVSLADGNGTTIFEDDFN